MKFIKNLIILNIIIGVNCFAQSIGAVPKTNSSPGSTLFSPMAGERPEGAKTEISSNEEATFDSEKNIAEFTGRVVVKDPQFTLTCERLVVKLGQSGNGIDQVEAIGNVMIIQEVQSEKKETAKAIGRAGSVTYRPSVGEMELRDFPSIQQGINCHVATEASTIMVLRSNGQSRTFGGGSKTLFVSKDSKAP